MKLFKICLFFLLLGGCDNTNSEEEGFIFRSESMLPSIEPPSMIRWEKISHKKELGTGDLVVIKSPVDHTSNWLRRVAATEDSVVEIRGGVLYTDGVKSPWVPASKETEDFGPVKVPDEHYFLIGENLLHARDSREFGPFHRLTVVGLVTTIEKMEK